MYIFTSESVGAGHPDKIADQISDLVLDLCLVKNANARVACETLVTKNLVILAGEISNVVLDNNDLNKEIRDLIFNLDYNQEGFVWDTLEIKNYIHSQSKEISECVDGQKTNCLLSGQGFNVIGAGDQGIMFGYASDETANLMPAPIYYAHKILLLINQARISGELPGILSDGKSQISFIYDMIDGFYKPIAIDNIVLSLNHKENLSLQDITAIGMEYIQKSIPKSLINANTKYYINPSGAFIQGGPMVDTGLTGRKIIVDTYGGMAPHGGGAFSGKDATKVDRSGAYLARYLAKNIVAAKIAHKCTVQISYAIGMSSPLSLFLDFHGTGKIDESIVSKKLMNSVDMTPSGIISKFNLTNPIYKSTAFGGHFGRDPQFSGEFLWEKTDLQDDLNKSI